MTAPSDAAQGQHHGGPEVAAAAQHGLESAALAAAQHGPEWQRHAQLSEAFVQQAAARAQQGRLRGEQQLAGELGEVGSGGAA